MSFATTVNIAAILLCLAVLVQSIRLMRALDAIKAGGLAPMVAGLEAATAEARRVLGHLTVLMRGDLAITAQTLDDGKAILDELAVMTGIGNAIAERIVEAAAAGNRAPPETPTAPAPPAAQLPPACIAADPVPQKGRARTMRPTAPPARSSARPPAPPAAPPASADLPPGSIAAAARSARRLHARLAAGDRSVDPARFGPESPRPESRAA
jgi:hypothetical protein